LLMSKDMLKIDHLRDDFRRFVDAYLIKYLEEEEEEEKNV